MSASLSEILSKKPLRQQAVEIMRMKAAHLDPLYEWCLDRFDEDSHPFLPLALSLTYGRLLSSFLLRQAPADDGKKHQPSYEGKEAKPKAGGEKETEAQKDQRTESKGEAKELSTNKQEKDSSETSNRANEEKTAEATPTAPNVIAPLEPSIAQDPAVSQEDRQGLLLRVAKFSGKLPRLQLTSRVAEHLDGFVNDLMRVLHMINDPTKDTLAVTTVVEKARAMLPKGDHSDGVFGKLLTDDESSRAKSEKLFCIFADLALGWTAEKVRRSTEAYHDFTWLCNQLDITDTDTHRMAWKATGLYKTVAQNQDALQTYPSRRYALLAACAVTGLWKIVSLYGKGTKEGKPPPTKRARLSDADATSLVDRLVEAARKEAVFTRWISGSSGRWKIAADLQGDEIRQAILSFAQLLLFANQQEMTPQYSIPRFANHNVWWQAISEMMDKFPSTAQWEELADNLYTQQLDRGENKTVSQNIKTLHESKIMEYEKFSSVVPKRTTIVLVDRVVWEKPTGVNPRTSIIVSKGPGVEEVEKVSKMFVAPAVEDIKRQSLVPSMLDEGLELNAWTVAILSVEEAEPTENLVRLLENASPGKQSSWQDAIPKIINKSLLLLLQESLTAKVGRKASVSMNSECETSVSGELTHDKALCRGLIAFFFHSLESILLQEVGTQSLDETFLRAILACCMTCVVQAAGLTRKIHPKFKDSPVYSFMQMTESTPMSFLHYAPIFRKHLTNPENESHSPLPRGLPRRVLRDFLHAELATLDTVLWTKDPNFEDVLPDRVDDLIETNEKDCCWWPVRVLIDENEEDATQVKYPSTKEDPYYLEIYHTLSVLMDRTLEVSYKRMERVCRALGTTHWRLLLKYTWRTFRHLLRRHIKLFYDRHIDHWILTTIYGVGRRLKFGPEITFAKIIDVYIDVRGPEIGKLECQNIIRQVKIKKDEGSNVLGHIIVLYNKVFLPAMQSHLLESNYLKEGILRLSQAKESPQLDVPETSEPSKTSAAHQEEPEDNDVEMSTSEQEQK